MKNHIRAAATQTQVSTSQQDIQKTLARYGAVGFGFSTDYEHQTIHIRFEVPRTDAPKERLKVEIPLSIKAVYKRLNAGKNVTSSQVKGKMEQAERVAWRQLHLFVEAGLAAVAVGLQSIEDAFMAHTMVTDSDGREGRLADYLATMRTIGQGQLPALPAPKVAK